MKRKLMRRRGLALLFAAALLCGAGAYQSADALGFSGGRTVTYVEKDGFSYPYALMDRTGKMWYVHTPEGEDLTDQLKWIGEFSEGVAHIELIGGQEGLIRPDGEVLWLVEDYVLGDRVVDGLLSFRKGVDGERGYMTPEGEVRFYIDRFHYASFSDGMFLVEGDRGDGTLRYGYADQDGALVVSPTYRNAYAFSEGYAAVQMEDGRWAFIDKSGQVVLDNGYSAVKSFSEGRAFAQKRTVQTGENGEEIVAYQAVLLDYTGREIPLDGVDAVKIFSDPYTHNFSEGVAVVYGENGLCGTIDREGNQVMPFLFNGLGDCSEGLHETFQGDTPYKVYGLCDQTGAQVLDADEKLAYSVSEGMIERTLYDSKTRFYIVEHGYIRNPVTVPSEWAEAEYNRGYEQGIVPKELRTFPGWTVNREQFAQLAVEVLEKQAGRVLPAAGLDVFGDTMDYDVRKLYDLEIIDGMAPGEFGPEETLTREQAAKILTRILERAGAVPEELEEPNYPDADRIAEYARYPVSVLYTTGLMLGKDTGFDPQGTLTKEEAVAAMVRLVDYVAETVQ